MNQPVKSLFVVFLLLAAANLAAENTAGFANRNVVLVTLDGVRVHIGVGYR